MMPSCRSGVPSDTDSRHSAGLPRDSGVAITKAWLAQLPRHALVNILLRALSRDSALTDLVRTELAKDRPAPPDEEYMVGESAAMRAVFDRMRRYAASDAPVLIEGESGTGKELAARAIHERSARARGPLVPVNCAALPPNLIASELFGHEKGAFTGAMARRIGHIEAANGGTLFLDEIGDLPLETQGYFLRVLQDGRVTRVGATESRAVNIRVVAATNVSLRDAVRAGRFREDLYYRLAILTLEMPPLRERGGDLELLATYLLRVFAAEHDRMLDGFTEDALAGLRRHPWPGNVRELIACVRRGVVMAHGPLVALDDLGLLDRGAPPVPPEATRAPRGEALDREAVEGALRRNGMNVSRTARDLGVARCTLYRTMQRLGVAQDAPATPAMSHETVEYVG